MKLEAKQRLAADTGSTSLRSLWDQVVAKLKPLDVLKDEMSLAWKPSFSKKKIPGSRASAVTIEMDARKESKKSFCSKMEKAVKPMLLEQGFEAQKYGSGDTRFVKYVDDSIFTVQVTYHPTGSLVSVGIIQEQAKVVKGVPTFEYRWSNKR